MVSDVHIRSEGPAVASQDEVLFFKRGAVGVIVLNRPKAWNAGTPTMCQSTRMQVLAYAADSSISCILVQSCSSKFFSVGGDVKTSARLPPDEAILGFKEEYLLNDVLGHLKKPVITLMDGLALGAGVSISCLSHCVIATERTVTGTPECSIGHFPDAAASFFLNRLPGQLGTYLGLTGTRLQGGEVVAAGLATHLVPAHRLEELREGLFSLGSGAGHTTAISSLLSSLEVQVSPTSTGPLAHMEAINSCFCFDTMEQIFDALQQRGDQWGRETLAVLRRCSPLSLKIALRVLRWGRGQALADCVQMDFRVAMHIMRRDSDFKRGVTALLVTRGGGAQWQPATLQEVTNEQVDQYFEPLTAAEELQLYSSNPIYRRQLYSTGREPTHLQSRHRSRL